MLTSSGQKRYEYVGLEKIDGLRLLHIERPTIHHHGESTSPAQLSDCRLHLVETSLARAPPYQTVSYAWGDSDRRCSMALANGEIIDITNHLSVALPYFLAATKHEYLWIDQICINQMDLDERAQQVSMMGQIYEKGDGVLVFLCEGRQANPLLQDILRTIDFPMGDCELGWGPGADLKRAFRLIETLLGGNPEVERPEQWCEDPVVKAFHTHHVRGEAVGRDVSWHALRSMISEIFTSTWASLLRR
ncbi:HET-domain-containing protein [Teratosphaeria destructans]|uniref:HET-domain-containing protein n=1 Tax=Teratosphaeria destructans TaxID=418781 RepID=A0A9W7W022_9PEZI|nr:HET-domain-containing protein [Teratosphaeria destructans]